MHFTTRGVQLILSTHSNVAMKGGFDQKMIEG